MHKEPSAAAVNGLGCFLILLFLAFLLGVTILLARLLDEWFVIGVLGLIIFGGYAARTTQTTAHHQWSKDYLRRGRG